MSELRIEHLSNSSIGLYSECGRAWRGKYVDGLKSPTTVPLLIGSVFDKVLERYFTLKAGGAGDLTEQELAAAWTEEWQAHTTREEIAWGDTLPQAAENEGARLIAAAATAEQLRKLMPLVDETGPALQRRIELRVPGVPIPAIGFLDIVTDDGVPGDFKTSARAWPDGKARHEIQPRLYLAALLQRGYRPPGGRLLFRHFVFTKTKNTQVQVIETEFTAREVFVAVDLVQEAWRGISAGVFMPNPRSWLCNSACHMWAGCMGRK